ncbi:hypothetical protein [Pelistega ratti]|uniref:hypothetical protein n=1 Tax=Pelistega ratti TaxID=2652177 RepID=UPI001FA963C4
MMVVIPYFILSFLAQYLAYLLKEENHFILRLNRYLILLPLGLAWFSFYIRIQSYGFSSQRIFLGAILLYISIYAFLNLSLSWIKYRQLAGISIIFIILFGFILDTRSLSYQLQTQRLAYYLKKADIVDSSGRIKEIDLLALYQQPHHTQNLLYASRAANVLVLAKYYKDYERKIDNLVLTYGEEKFKQLLSLKRIDLKKCTESNHCQSSIEPTTTGFYTNFFYTQNRQDWVIEQDQLDTFKRIIYPVSLSISPDPQGIITIDYKGTLLTFSIDQHIEAIFKKHGLEVTQLYSDTTFEPLKRELLQIDLPDALITLHEASLHYRNNRYTLSAAEVLSIMEKDTNKKSYPK